MSGGRERDSGVHVELSTKPQAKKKTKLETHLVLLQKKEINEAVNPIQIAGNNPNNPEARGQITESNLVN